VQLLLAALARSSSLRHLEWHLHHPFSRIRRIFSSLKSAFVLPIIYDRRVLQKSIPKTACPPMSSCEGFQAPKPWAPQHVSPSSTGLTDSGLSHHGLPPCYHHIGSQSMLRSVILHADTSSGAGDRDAQEVGLLDEETECDQGY
jgi:hypothetical protein